MKRAFDFSCALLALVVLSAVILVTFLIASWDTRALGFFVQWRVSQDGRIFRLVKIRTMRPEAGSASTVTTSGDARITPVGYFLRRTKLDELPQLFNVLWGDMSLVGPRPDVPGFADSLEGEDRIILTVRPGITGPATLAYRDEEKLLATASDPEKFNREVIFPDKVRLNREYVQNWTFRRDLYCIWKTIAGY